MKIFELLKWTKLLIRINSDNESLIRKFLYELKFYIKQLIIVYYCKVYLS